VTAPVAAGPQPAAAAPCRVLLVDDSAAFRAGLARALESDPAIRVVGEAGDGRAALALAVERRPDVITMDVIMPKMDGIEASRAIMASCPRPIVLMSSLAGDGEQRAALSALRLGVVDVTGKPVLVGPTAEAQVASVARLVKAAAAVQVARPPRRARPGAAREPTGETAALVAVAASTGGPTALEQVLGRLGPGSPPVVVAQHLADGFARGFAGWLGDSLRRPVRLVVAPEPLRDGTIYLAAERRHLIVRAGMVDAPPARPGELCPNGDRLLAAAAACYGASAVGVVLTGMGSDGAAGLLAMRDAGAPTLAQDRASSVVWGMPRAAAEAGRERLGSLRTPGWRRP
jgi:two-component system chemotaxis response regulator CheB